jgi:hypothetical protein
VERYKGKDTREKIQGGKEQGNDTRGKDTRGKDTRRKRYKGMIQGGKI